MDIGSTGSYPSNKLSNFAGHRFVIDGIQCNSMEGFLQSLKFKNPEMQEHVCALVGKSAKFKGKKKKWYRDQVLYWQGEQYKRDSNEYAELIAKAYTCMAKQSQSFQRAILASKNATLTHSMGKNKKNETVLTEQEFCSNLYRVRKMLQETE